MEKLKLIIVGAGAQARYILNTNSLLEESGQTGMDVVGLVDSFNNPTFWGRMLEGVPVLGNLDILKNYRPSSNLRVITAIADLRVKRQTVSLLEKLGYEFCNIIHPSAQIARQVQLGIGIIINAGVIIESGSTIGSHVIIHAGSVVEHDNILGDFVNLGPGATTAGRVKIGTGATLYTRAVVIPDVQIGEDTIVGAGAVVIRDVSPRSKVAGVPAREI